MFIQNPKILSTRDYLSSPPVGLLLDGHGDFPKPGFHGLMDMDRDSRFGLKFALDIATGRTTVGRKDRPRVMLWPLRANWPRSVANLAMADVADDIRRQIHIESGNPTEPLKDALDRWMAEVQPDVIVVDAFKPVRRPVGMSVGAFLDGWAKARRVLMFGVVAW